MSNCGTTDKWTKEQDAEWLRLYEAADGDRDEMLRLVIKAYLELLRERA